MAKSLKTIARPYAKAVFAHAFEQNAFEKWTVFLQDASQIAADARIVKLLNYPGVSDEQILSLFLSILPKENIEKDQKDFLHLLAVKRRLSLLPEITSLFEQLQSELQNTVDAEVISAFELTKDQEKRLERALKRRLKKESVRIHCTVDATILGGAIIRAGDFVIDGSGRGQLEELKKYLQF